MRRKDREVTDPVIIEEVIKDCNCCHLGLNDNGSVYIVPLSFGYEIENEKYILYFHSAKEGRKIDIINRSQDVCFEMETGYNIYGDKIACSFSATFKSIIGYGDIKILDDKNEKIKGLTSIMKHNTGKDDWKFDDRAVKNVAVLKLEVRELSCKVHN